MYRPENRAWLVDIRDRVGQGQALTSAECLRLTAGFIGVNSICDLAEFFGRVLQNEPTPVAPGLTHADLHPWLCPQRDPTHARLDPSVLVSFAAVLQLSEPPLAGNPHRNLNFWLAREAILGVAGVPGATAQAIAVQAFQDLLLGSGLAPTSCSRRNPAVLQAFGHWWKVWSKQLTEVVQTAIPRVICPERNAAQQLRALAELLAAELPVEPLAELVVHRNNQLTLCRGQLNRELVAPTSPGFVVQLGSRLLAAAESGEEAELTAADAAELVRLGVWLEETGLDTRLNADGLQESGLWKVARSSPQGEMIPAHAVPPLLGECQRLERVLRTRGDIRLWGRSVPVEDLFAYPLPIRFDRWLLTLGKFGFG